jgi:WD40 repeat protein
MRHLIPLPFFFLGATLLISGSFHPLFCQEPLTPSRRAPQLVPQVGQWVESIALSPNAQYAITCAFDQEPRLWEVATGSILRRFPGRSAQGVCAGFSPDGSKVVTASSDGSITISLIDTGKILFQFLLSDNAPKSLAFSHDGRFLAVGGQTTAIWDLESRASYAQLPDSQPVAFSADDRNIVTRDLFHVTVWNLKTKHILRSIDGHADTIRDAVLSPDSRRVLTASLDNTARIWDVATGKEIVRFTKHHKGALCGAVLSVAFAPDGRRALSVGCDETARLWDSSSGEEIRAFPMNPGQGPIAFSPNGMYLIAGNTIWNPTTGSRIRDIPGGYAPPLLSCCNVGTDVVLGTYGRSPGAYFVRHLHLSSGIHSSDTRSFPLRSGESVWALSPDGRFALGGSGQDETLIHDLETGTTTELRGHSSPRFGAGYRLAIVDGAISPDDRYAATVGGDNTTRLWSLPSGTEIRRYTRHPVGGNPQYFAPGTLAISTSSRFLMFSDVGRLHLWDLTTDTEVWDKQIAPDTKSNELTQTQVITQVSFVSDDTEAFVRDPRRKNRGRVP